MASAGALFGTEAEVHNADTFVHVQAQSKSLKDQQLQCLTARN